MKNISNKKFDYLYFNISYLYLRRGKMSATTHHIKEKVRLPINNFVFSVQKKIREKMFQYIARKQQNPRPGALKENKGFP